MTWALINLFHVQFQGTRDAALRHGALIGACTRNWHDDGTELAPRMEKGWSVVPLIWIEQCAPAVIPGRVRR